MKSIFRFAVLLAAIAVHLQTVEAFSVSTTKTNHPHHQEHDVDTASSSSSSSINSSRRDYLLGALLVPAAATVITSFPPASVAFDGSGSSAYAGRGPATKAELKRGYQERVAADARDFNTLGKAIRNGETEGNAWVSFFIQFQRREPDAIGRTYAALADLRGLRIKKEEFEGGDGLLLANTFTKAGKPPDNTPAVKSFRKLSQSFDAIESAGKQGDAKKALVAWEKTKILFEAFLADVEMPSSLEDPIYN